MLNDLNIYSRTQYVEIIEINDIIVIKGKMCMIAIIDIMYAMCHN